MFIVIYIIVRFIGACLLLLYYICFPEYYARLLAGKVISEITCFWVKRDAKSYLSQSVASAIWREYSASQLLAATWYHLLLVSSQTIFHHLCAFRWSFSGRIACTQCMRCGLLLQMSHVAWSVCLCVGHTGVLCQNVWVQAVMC